MPGRRMLASLCVAGLAIAGCSPTPTPPPSITAPPVAADFVPWVDLVWMTGDLPVPPLGVLTEQMSAVAAGPDGFVAVGYHENGPVRDGVVWFSPDGSSWSVVGRPDLFANVELLDVEVADDGFFVLGVASGGPIGDHAQAVVYRSADGSTWERLPPLPGALDTFPGWLAVSGTRVLVAGSADDGGAVTWLSEDGRRFDRITPGGDAADGLADSQGIPGGFIAVGSAVGTPVALRSSDGLAWTASIIDGGPDVVAIGMVVGRWGYVAEGLFAPGCGPGASCGGQSIAWWSGDGRTWGRLPDDDSPVSNGGSVVAAAGAHGFVAVDGASAWSSPDGWRWRPLPEPGDGSFGIGAAAVWGDVIVAVGQESRDDGTSEGRVLVGLEAGP